MRLLLSLVALAALPSVAQADLIYEFAGVLPVGASENPMVQDGESFLAMFVVNPATVDSDPDPHLGDYQSAGNILSGSISFSGGYSVTVPDAPINYGTFVYDELPLGDIFDPFFDSVTVQGANSDFSFLLEVGAQVENDQPFSNPTLPNDSLPSAGTAFVSSGGTFIGYLQLEFWDGNGLVRYNAFEANNVSFNARTSQDTVLGDVNLDGVVSLLDVQPFVTLITSGGFQAEADINMDGVVDLLDVQPFVQLLTGG